MRKIPTAIIIAGIILLVASVDSFTDKGLIIMCISLLILIGMGVLFSFIDDPPDWDRVWGRKP